MNHDAKINLEAKSSALYDEYGCFFAFSDSQFKEKADPKIKYARLNVGILVPLKHAKIVTQELADLHKQFRVDHIKNNSIDAVIEYELNNYECYYINDFTDAIEPLDFYGITPEQIESVFYATQQKYLDQL